MYKNWSLTKMGVTEILAEMFIAGKRGKKGSSPNKTQ
jgi:hypothetical protein